MFPSLDDIQSVAQSQKKDTQKFLKKLKQKPPKQLDILMQNLHEKTFSEFDCLGCANCCKTTGPLFTENDIQRIAKSLRMKPAAFENAYLRTDEDGDKVLQQLPCPFLGADNYCQIYEARPKACREYPHTDRKKFYQINALTLKNVAICPAANVIVERLKAILEEAR